MLIVMVMVMVIVMMMMKIMGMLKMMVMMMRALLMSKRDCSRFFSPWKGNLLRLQGLYIL